jgi:hypothetical protein
MVDAAPPESYVAYRFEKAVDNWLLSGEEETREWLVEMLQSWALNHEQLAPAFASSEILSEVEAHSVHLEQLAQLGLRALTGELSLAEDPDRERLFTKASGSYGGTLLAVTGPVKKLVERAPRK